MILFWLKRRRVALAAAVLLASGLAMTAVLADPIKPLTTALGAGWQCQQFVWITSCTRVQSAVPTARAGHPEPAGLLRV